MIESITLASGCFWCYQPVFEMLKGVTAVEVGYAGGFSSDPTYQEVSTQNTNHAECYRVVFDNSLIKLEDILEVFWYIHDPTTLNQQGNDIGTQYRSAIFYENESQKVVAEVSKANHQRQLAKPIVTEISKLEKFYTAEEYHQKFFEKNPTNTYCIYSILPKIDKIKSKFANLLK